MRESAITFFGMESIQKQKKISQIFLRVTKNILAVFAVSRLRTRLAELSRGAQQMSRLREAAIVEHTLPSRVMDQVAARHAAEPQQPAFETAVPAVHVLHMDCATRANAGFHVHRFMRDASLRRVMAIDDGAVADQ